MSCAPRSLACTAGCARNHKAHTCAVHGLLLAELLTSVDLTSYASTQVWWTLRDDSNSTVFAHDVAKGVTTELPDICSDATVSCLGLDRAGRVWMGCQGGQVQVWCPVFQRPICHGHALSAVSIG